MFTVEEVMGGDVLHEVVGKLRPPHGVTHNIVVEPLRLNCDKIG